MMRTHTCGELNEKNINTQATLCGWVSARRDHGKITFIDIRDRYGITQVVFFPKPDAAVYEAGKKLRNEDVISVTGTVNMRPANTQNSKLATGMIELGASAITVLNRAEDLPFPIEDTIEIGEETRLAHRYLDLRRKKMSDNIQLRHRLNQAFRGFLNEKRFLEIETPFLTKSTPEGARDFLVPSRLSVNKFYALPQSPQLFKQILMVSGMDRYYQIVRCFRDEDLRKDRQPEFTQLDIEMSFVEEEDIFSLMEEMYAKVFQDVLGITLKTPFPRMTYSEATTKYGSDKPDIRGTALEQTSERFACLWVVDFPLFEYNADEKCWQACHHPFTAPRSQDIEHLDADLSKVYARSYDLVINGEEIGSGSIRIHSSQLQQKIFSILGISDEDARTKFGFLLKAFRYGAPPHAGVAFGLDRLYAIISGSESIRDVIAFPKTQKGSCPMSEAPSFVSQKQLDELNIEIVKQEESTNG